MLALLGSLLVLVVGLWILFMIIDALPPRIKPPDNIVRIVVALIDLCVLVVILRQFGMTAGLF